jgi:hypothetical protein
MRKKRITKRRGRPMSSPNLIVSTVRLPKPLHRKITALAKKRTLPSFNAEVIDRLQASLKEPNKNDNGEGSK